MAEREKVVGHLYDCLAASKPENMWVFVRKDIVGEALALLKKQEAKQIIRKQGKRENSDGSIDYFGEWYCPHCGKLLNRGFDLPWIEFCYKCGGAVKWNDG